MVCNEIRWSIYNTSIDNTTLEQHTTLVAVTRKVGEKLHPNAAQCTTHESRTRASRQSYSQFFGVAAERDECRRRNHENEACFLDSVHGLVY